MKQKIHPKYYKKAKVTCACGNNFEVGSTVEQISTELCSMCHPFYTGTQRLVDTARRVDKFKKTQEKHALVKKDRKGKKVKKAKRAAAKKAKEKTLKVKVDK